MKLSEYVRKILTEPLFDLLDFDEQDLENGALKNECVLQGIYSLIVLEVYTMEMLRDFFLRYDVLIPVNVINQIVEEVKRW